VISAYIPPEQSHHSTMTTRYGENCHEGVNDCDANLNLIILPVLLG
jgi:hypothetical protein